MKKLISLLLSAFMLFAFSGCDVNIDSGELEEAIISGVISGVEDYLEEEYPEASETEEAIETETSSDIEESSETAANTETEESAVTEAVTEEASVSTEASTTATTTAAENEAEEEGIDENGVYTSKDDVALYIYTYGKLPKNFITKKEAQALGWEGGSLEPYAPGMCIGGSYFGNYEGLLPEKDGREYTECDIDTLGKSKRGAKRIVFSNDGLIYYTDDHYESFELLYGEE